REAFLAAAKENYRLSALTNLVVDRLPHAPLAANGRLSVKSDSNTGTSSNLIDTYLFQAMQDAGVTPAGKTNDFEFIRRVTLDLTGRIPIATQVQTFVADIRPDKRAALID